MVKQQTNFTGEQAAPISTGLREALGYAPEQFPASAFVGMVRNGVDQLRAQGRTDEEIAELIERAIGVKLPAVTITENYTSSEDPGHHRE